MEKVHSAVDGDKASRPPPPRLATPLDSAQSHHRVVVVRQAVELLAKTQACSAYFKDFDFQQLLDLVHAPRPPSSKIGAREPAVDAQPSPRPPARRRHTSWPSWSLSRARR